MKVRYLYVPEVLGCRPTDRLADAAQTLARAGVGALAVADDHGRVVGIISERDLTRAVADKVDPGTVNVIEYASPTVRVAGLDEDSADAGRRMFEAGVRHLPVMDDGRVVGMVSMRDLLAVETWG